MNVTMAQYIEWKDAEDLIKRLLENYKNDSIIVDCFTEEDPGSLGIRITNFSSGDKNDSVQLDFPKIRKHNTCNPNDYKSFFELKGFRKAVMELVGTIEPKNRFSFVADDACGQELVISTTFDKADEVILYHHNRNHKFWSNINKVSTSVFTSSVKPYQNNKPIKMVDIVNKNEGLRFQICKEYFKIEKTLKEYNISITESDRLRFEMEEN